MKIIHIKKKITFSTIELILNGNNELLKELELGNLFFLFNKN